MPQKFHTFKTERLFLRPTAQGDGGLILGVMNSPKFIEFVGDRGLRTVEGAEEYIQEKMIPQLERLGYSNYAIIRQSDGEKLGVCGLYDRQGVEGVDIGFAMLPKHEGHGYCFEAANRIKQAAFETYNINEIKGIVSKNHVASQYILEKLGLSLVGPVKLPGESEEVLLYQINSPLLK